MYTMGASQVTLEVKNPPANAGDMRCTFDPWLGTIPLRRAWQLTPVFLPGESHGHRSLVGFSPWGHEESDTTERLSTHSRHPESGEGGAASLSRLPAHPLRAPLR